MTAFPKPFGRYELTERLALGGMAELFLARSTGAHGFEKEVVIKCILPHLASSDQFTEMFISEAKITARLSHPKIAQTYELGQFGERLYIAMEFVDGMDVLALLRECAHSRRRVPRELSVYIAREMLDALDFAHQQGDGSGASVVHRDISPSNILVSRRGDVKLVDFGIARAMADEDKSKSGALKGKYGYMSPEQVVGEPLGPRSDLFSAAVVLAEMLMGRRLFAAPNELDVLLMVRDVDLSRLERFGKHIDSELMTIVEKGLSKDPEGRFESAAEFRDALDEWLFNQGKRVSSKMVADLVWQHYENASNRRKNQLEQTLEELEHESAMEAEGDEQYTAAAQGTQSGEIETKKQSQAEDDSNEAAITEERSTASALVDVPTVVRELDPAARDFDDSELSDLTLGEGAPARARRPSGPMEVEETQADPAEMGSLEQATAIGLIYCLSKAKATGLLKLSLGEIRKDLYFVNGAPEYVSSNLAGELFGAYLVSQGELSEGELDMALAMMPHYGSKLGDTLVGLGLLKPLDVFRHLTRQVREKVVDVCTWESGEYQWYPGKTSAKESFPLDIDPYEIIGVAVQKISVRSLEEWFETNAELNLKSVRNSIVAPESFRLGPELRAVYNQLSGQRSLREERERLTSPIAQEAFLRRVLLLVQAELASLDV